MYVKPLTAATATNSAPSAATAGVPLRTKTPGVADTGLGEADSAVVLVASTAGSGVMTVTLKLWGHSPLSDTWHPIGTNSDSTKRGMLNEGNAITENATDIITHAEIVQGISAFTRVYVEVTAIGGTATAISVWLVNVGVAA